MCRLLIPFRRLPLFFDLAVAGSEGATPSMNSKQTTRKTKPRQGETRHGKTKRKRQAHAGYGKGTPSPLHGYLAHSAKQISSQRPFPRDRQSEPILGRAVT
jgi:hypothetical protein